MRNLLLTLLFLLTASLPAAAGDDPRLLEHLRDRTSMGHSPNLRADVNMVLVPVTVLDDLGRNVLGLDRRRFHVFDSSRPMDIAAFSRQDQPISIGLIYDCSGSMRGKFRTAREAPAALYRQLSPDDESFLITFSDRPVLREGFTSQFGDIENDLAFTNPSGSTSLVDSVVLGLDQMRRARNPRKALVIVSDGGDNNSRYTMHELVERAVESDTQIFSIGLHQDPQSIEEFLGPQLLSKLSQVTGGFHYSVTDLNDLGDVMARIGVTLHNQYVLGYYPPPGIPTGKYHRIRVKLDMPKGFSQFLVFSRAGYYAPAR